GVLRCGHCGHALWGMDSGKHKRRYYECGKRRDQLKEEVSPDGVCPGTTVSEHVVLQAIAEHLDNWLGLEGEALGASAHFGALKQEDLPDAFDGVKKLLVPPAKPVSDRKRLEKTLRNLESELANARGKLVWLDLMNIPAAQNQIRQREEERAAVERELALSKPPAAQDLNTIGLYVLHSLYAIADCCRILTRPTIMDAAGNRALDLGDRTVKYSSLVSEAPKVIRGFLSRVSHIACHTVKEGWGTRTRHVLEGGEIVFNLVGAVMDNLNPHNPGKSRVCCR